jgi:hypothetical protein
VDHGTIPQYNVFSQRLTKGAIRLHRAQCCLGREARCQAARAPTTQSRFSVLRGLPPPAHLQAAHGQRFERHGRSTSLCSASRWLARLSEATKSTARWYSQSAPA